MEPPRYLQIYFHGPGELDYRMQQGGGGLVRDLLEALQEELKGCNAYVRDLKAIMEVSHEPSKVVIRAKKKLPTGVHVRTYNTPTAGEVAALFPDETEEPLHKQDLILHLRHPGPNNQVIQRIPATHHSYDPLYYVLLFPYGNSGYEIGMRSVGGAKISIAKYYRYSNICIQKDFLMRRQLK